MKSVWQYACSNGENIIGEPGTREHAQEIFERNYWAAVNCNDRARFKYKIVRRRVAYGEWIDND